MVAAKRQNLFMWLRCRDLEVSWREWGHGEPLVLVHGLGDDHRTWRNVLPWLVVQRRVIAYDLRGHGETELGEAAGTLAQLADDLVALLDALELDRADLAGHSLGGTVVLRAAIESPDRVRRLFPIATSSRVGRRVAPWYRDRAQLAERGHQALLRRLREDTESMFTSSRYLDDQWLIRSQATADPRGFANGCRAMARLLEEPLDPDLGRITASTLVVSAEKDTQCPPRAGEAMAAAIPGASLEVIRGAGHQVQVEQAEALSRAMLGFAR